MERKYKKTDTTEILDYINKDISYEETKKIEKQHDFKDELEHREPFRAMKRKIENMQDEINELKKEVKLLISHEHGCDGKVNVPIKKTIDERRFLY